MDFEGTLSIAGDDTDPLPVRCEVDEDQLTITTLGGETLGEWGIRQIGVQRTGDTFTIQVEGETLNLRADRPDALATALGLDDTPRISERVAAARTSQKKSERIQWGVVAAVVAGLIGVAIVAAAVLGIGPFERSNAPEAAPSAATSVQATTPPTTNPLPTTRPLTLQEQKNLLHDIWLTYMQENEAGVLGYWTRATEASANQDWAVMGAECKLGQSISQFWRTVLASSTVRPPPVYPMFQAIVDEVDLMFFWCSGGTRYSAESAATHHDVAVELVRRINAEFGIATRE